MAHPRLALAFLTAVALAACAGPLLATGGEDVVAPSLDFYLGRLPGKSFDQVNGVMAAREMKLDASAIKAVFASGPSPRAVRKIDALLQQAHTHYESPVISNLLQDFRDLAAGHATPAEAAQYVSWRLVHQNPAEMKPEDIDDFINSSSKEMKPHWIYLKGAILFKASHDDTKSETCFLQVINDFPESPRAETALFMQGRCAWSQSLNEDGTLKDKAAEAVFEDYLKTYPQGRFRSDVLGWLGGIAYRGNDIAGAISYFMQQVDDPEHPENVGPADAMIEQCLISDPTADPVMIDTIAQHPTIALALTYFIINNDWDNSSKAYDDFQNTNGRFDENANLPRKSQIKNVRNVIFPILAAKVLEHKSLYRGDVGQDRYFAVLAHAASDQGDQEKALQLVEMAGNRVAKSDDLAYVKALILARAKKSNLALSVFQDFLDDFPNSPLAHGAKFRFALALHDAKRDGQALLILASLHQNTLPLGRDDDPANEGPVTSYSHEYPDLTEYPNAPSKITRYSIDQTMDSILNFAPVEELAKLLKNSEPGLAGLKKDLKSVLVQRCVAAEDFTKAAGFSDSLEEKRGFLKLAAQVRAIQTNTGQAAADLSVKFASYWKTDEATAAMAGPLTDHEVFCNREMHNGFELQRRGDGQLLGYPNVDGELFSRFPAQHWGAWWQRVFDASPSGPTAPTALGNVIESKRVLARSSVPYTLAAAHDLNFPAETRTIYGQLVQKYPSSPEAHGSAAYISLPDALKMNPVTDMFAFWDYLDACGFGTKDVRLFLPDPGSGSGNKRPDVLPYSGVGNLEAENDVGFAKQVADNMKELQRNVRSMDDIPAVAAMEDFEALSSVPNLDENVRNRYIDIRATLDGISSEDDTAINAEPSDPMDALRKDPTMEPIRDFIDCFHLYLLSSTIVLEPYPDKQKYPSYTYPTRKYPELVTQAEAFLKKYPKSLKREAVYILLLRGIVMTGYYGQDRLLHPSYDPWTGAPYPALISGKFDQAAFDKTLAEFQAEFPRSHYADTVFSLIAKAAFLEKDWDNAVTNWMVVADDLDTHPEFTLEAETEFHRLFDTLEDPSTRADLLHAILKQPKAKALLAQYVNGGGVPFYKDFLLDQIGR